MGINAAAQLLAGLWAGALLTIGGLAAPAAFAVLPPADAGRVVARLFAYEAYFSLAAGLVLVLIEQQRPRFAADAPTAAAARPATRSVMTANLLLVLGTLFCTVAGYFGVQPMMAAARSGQGTLSFAALHALSGGLFALKGSLVLALAWRLCAASVSRPYRSG